MRKEAARCLRCGTLCYDTDNLRRLKVEGKPNKDIVKDFLECSPAP